MGRKIPLHATTAFFIISVLMTMFTECKNDQKCHLFQAYMYMYTCNFSHFRNTFLHYFKNVFNKVDDTTYSWFYIVEVWYILYKNIILHWLSVSYHSASIVNWIMYHVPHVSASILITNDIYCNLLIIHDDDVYRIIQHTFQNSSQ